MRRLISTHKTIMGIMGMIIMIALISNHRWKDLRTIIIATFMAIPSIVIVILLRINTNNIHHMNNGQ